MTDTPCIVDCKWEPCGERCWRCPDCGFRTAMPNLRRNCPAHLPKRPTLPQPTPKRPTPPKLPKRLLGYYNALRRWAAAGRPIRTDEEVAELREICRACDKFNGQVCVFCGCHVVQPKVWGDKLRWKTEHCPIGKW